MGARLGSVPKEYRARGRGHWTGCHRAVWGPYGGRMGPYGAVVGRGAARHHLHTSPSTTMTPSRPHTCRCPLGAPARWVGAKRSGYAGRQLSRGMDNQVAGCPVVGTILRCTDGSLTPAAPRCQSEPFTGLGHTALPFLAGSKAPADTAAVHARADSQVLRDCAHAQPHFACLPEPLPTCPMQPLSPHP